LEYLIKTIKSTTGLKEANNNNNKDIINSCKVYQLGSSTKINNKLPFKEAERLIIFNINITGPFKTKGLKGESYFLTIIDRRTRTI